MGATGSKIDDRQRAKIYKRVSLIEAQDQFAKLPRTTWILGNPLYNALKSFPVSQNFDSCFNYDANHKDLILCLKSTDGAELDSAKFVGCTLYHLLQREDLNGIKVTTSPKEIPENYAIGLYKEQYEALYSSTEAIASSQDNAFFVKFQ